MGRKLIRSVDLAAPREAVFAFVDDQTRLAAHMEQPSTMMGGGRMTYAFDAKRGQAVGSHIRMRGTAFGLRLFVDEVVTDREPPRSKAWKTVGDTRLLILAGYEMGFEVDRTPAGSRLTMWIDYELPVGPARILGLLLAPMFARWCVDRMAGDAAGHFAAISFAQEATASA